MKLLSFLTVLFFGLSANAAIYFESCSNHDGSVNLIDGKIEIRYMDEKEIDNNRPARFLRRRVINAEIIENRICKLRGSQNDVVAESDKITFEQITYLVDPSEPEISAFVICRIEGNDIPDGDSCED